MTSELTIDNPYLLKLEVRRELASEAQIDVFLDQAKDASTCWRQVPISQRKALCTAAMAHMLGQKETLAADITRMMGKPIRQAQGEVDGMLERAEHMIEIAEGALAERQLPEKAGFERRIERVPLGVVFNMPAWNYPLLTCVNALVPALLAGNSVLLKHSARTALCGEHFADAFAAVGAPAGLVQALHCDHASAARIAGDRRVGYVAFTGSVAGGHAVYRAIAEKHFIDAGLELGGKDAAYVAADVRDTAKAAAALVDGACYNAGQSCCGIERIYVHRDRYADFTAAAEATVKALQWGDPTGPVDMGPMAQPKAASFLRSQVEEATRGGAKRIVGGHPTSHEGRGRFFEPTLLTDVDHSMGVMREESFGPIVAVMPVDSDAQAIQHINDSDLGLTASLWTQDRDRAADMASELEVGTVFMNRCDVLDPALPWTGVKDTGKGSTLSELGFMHLTRPRSIHFKLEGPQ